MNVKRKSKRQSLVGHLIENSTTVVVPQSTAQLLVRHAWLVLTGPPQTRDCIGINDAELVAVSGPLDDGAVVRGEKELEEKLPQLDGTLVWRERERREWEESKGEASEMSKNVDELPLKEEGHKKEIYACFLRQSPTPSFVDASMYYNYVHDVVVTT